MSLPTIPKDYQPSEKEPYMCDMHLAYFKSKLLILKDEASRVARETHEHLQVTDMRQPDLNDQAALAADSAVELRNVDRKRKLLTKIEAALERIDSGEYGYCEETGDPIGIERLKARPIATLCIEAQEMHERNEKQFIEDKGEDSDDNKDFTF